MHKGTRLIIIDIRVGVVKIYVTAVEALREKERDYETQFSTKIDGSLSFTPPLMLLYFFCRFSFQSLPVYDQPQGEFGCGAVFSQHNFIMLALMNIARGLNRGMGGIAPKNLNLCSKIVFHDWVLVPQGYFHNSVIVPPPPKVVDLGPSHKDMNLNFLGLTPQLRKLANILHHTRWLICIKKKHNRHITSIYISKQKSTSK